MTAAPAAPPAPAPGPAATAAPGATAGRRSSGGPARVAVGALVFGSLLAICAAVVPTHMSAYDAKIMAAVARAILHGRLSLPPGADPRGVNVPYANYGIGTSLVMVPFLALQRAAAARPDTVLMLVNPVLVALAGTLVYAVGRRLGFSRVLAVAVAWGFGTLTMALQSATELFSEPGVTVGLLLVLLGLLQWRAGVRRGPVIAGVGLAVAILFRSDSVVTVGCVLLAAPALRPAGRLGRRRALAQAAGLAVPVLAALAWTAGYSWLRSRTLIPPPYGAFDTPLATGLYGLTVSPGKGFLAFNPLLVLALPGALWAWRHQRGFVLATALLAVVRLAFFARWSAWTGGVSWGPRFLMPLTAPAALLAGFAVCRLVTAAGRLRRLLGAVVVAGLAAAAGVVNLASVGIGYWVAWNATKTVAAGVPAAARAAAVAAHQHAYLDTWHAGAIAVNLRRIAASGPSTLERLWPHPTTAGWALLAAAAALPVAAAVLARRCDRFPGGSPDPAEPTERPRSPQPAGVPSPAGRPAAD